MKHRGIFFYRMPTYGKNGRKRRPNYRGGSLKPRAADVNAMVDVLEWAGEVVSPMRARIVISSRSVHLNRVELKRGHDCVLRPSKAPNKRGLSRQLTAWWRNGVRQLDVIVDSAGGVNASALGIAEALRGWHGRKRILVDGACDSAATLILCLPRWDDSCITARSHVLIHHPTVTSYRRGDRTKHIRYLETTRGDSRRFVRMYRRKTGRKKKEIIAWMDAEKRFTAAEAVIVGLVGQMMPRTMWEEEVL